MNNVIEIEGRTVDEAIEKACASFGVPREKLSIDIISEGTSGFLGFGSKKAKIIAGLMSIDINDDIKPACPEEKPERPAIGERKPEITTPAPPPARPVAAPSPVKPVVAPPVKAVAAPPVSTPPVTSVAAAVESGEPMAAKAKDLLEGLLERMSIPSPVSINETEEALILNIQGDGDGLLIGKRGQNLDALQHIVNKAVNKTANGKKMIVVDTEAYRKRREESLVTLAERLGQKVKKTRKTVTVSNMNAHDRRIIHMALQNDTALLTKSRGEGEYRKIIIMPARRDREAGQTRNNVAAD